MKPEGFEREQGPGGLEIRVGPVDARSETRQDGDVRGITGYASLFDQPARIGGMFFQWDEEVATGAWTKTLRESSRILSMFNHDPDRLLGSTESGSAKFSEDATGLRYDVDVNDDDPLAVSAWAQVDRGDVNGASVWFRVIREEWTEPTEDNGLEVPKRRILEGQLFEGGPVVFPAFADTTAGTRSLPVPDGLLRAAGVPEGSMAARLAADMMADPKRAEREIRALLDDLPELREAVCACSPQEHQRAAEQAPAGSDTPPEHRHLSLYRRKASLLASKAGLKPKETAS